ncbi:hypothetical protein [Brevundimonas intermedia]|uniref:hypothetical protein n=1 Tax=Brevundimonas intermedia TaxID=74315 RepID=UPI001074B358|nr:hypothetical protein [Brevundimonas intermedia]
MKPVVVAALLLLPTGCAAVPEQSLGYPVTVDHRDGQCRYLIQDMWMSEMAMVERWFAALQARPNQVDIVWGDDQDQQCIELARRAVERVGQTSIVVRQGRPEDYPDLLRQTAQPIVH